jgi:hypothetical protein
MHQDQHHREDEADGDGRQLQIDAGKPEGKAETHRQREADENDDAGGGLGSEEAVAHTLVPGHDQVEERSHLDLAARGDVIDIKHPPFVKAVGKEARQSHGKSQKRERAPEGFAAQAVHALSSQLFAARASNSRTAAASRRERSG